MHGSEEDFFRFDHGINRLHHGSANEFMNSLEDPTRNSLRAHHEIPQRNSRQIHSAQRSFEKEKN